MFIDPNLWIGHCLFTKNDIHNVDWRYSEAREKVLGIIREVFTEEVELKLYFKEWPEFLQTKGICSIFLKGN